MSHPMEEVMNDVIFSKEVVLRLPRVGPRKVATSFEALECLVNEWPDWARGPSWRSAQVACRDALDGWRSAKSARLRFVRAARQAGLIEGERHRDILSWREPHASAAHTAGLGLQ
jgi:hypothetical protein